jgi:hypothetical protein
MDASGAYPAQTSAGIKQLKKLRRQYVSWLRFDLTKIQKTMITIKTASLAGRIRSRQNKSGPTTGNRPPEYKATSHLFYNEPVPNAYPPPAVYCKY